MLFDASAWIELFIGSDYGKTVRDILSIHECYTSMTTISEIANWATKQGKDPDRFINDVIKQSQIIPLDCPTASLAGKLNFERKKTNKKWGMLDSFVLATSLLYNLRILTKDPDFKDLPNAEVLS